MNYPILLTVLAILATGLLPTTDTHATLAFLPLLVGGLASLVGGVIGAEERGGAEKKAAQQEAQALKRWLDINIPSVQEQEVYLQKLRSAGQLSPELETTFQQAESEMSGIQTDPRLKDAQMAALTGLEGVVDAGGANLQDKANLEQIQGENATAERGSREAIMQNMRQRGVAGSGLEMAAAMDNQQAAAGRNNVAGLGIAAQAQQRALDAMMQGGQLAGQMQGQNFDQKSKIAAANDAINRFNTSNSQDVLQRNTANKNASNQFNLTNDQRISDANAGIANTQEMHNKGLKQTNFQNRTAIAAGAGGQQNAAAASTRNAGKDSAAMWGGVGQAINSAATTLGKPVSAKDTLDNKIAQKKLDAMEEQDKLNGWN